MGVLVRRAIGLRADQDMEAARAAIAAAAKGAPDAGDIALMNAQLHFETWQPAAALFDRARALRPEDPAVLAGLAGALAAEGDVDAAETCLADALVRHPGWIAGHWQLAMLRVTRGRPAGFDRSFAEACRADPANPGLRLAWFHLLSSARDWPAARRVVAAGLALFGRSRGLDLAAVFLASESDEASRDPRLFDRVAAVQDAGLDLCRVRFWLRNGRPDVAADIVGARRDGATQRIFLPYLALARRLLGDARAGPLDGEEATATIDLGFTPADLHGLAGRLRELLTMRAPYLEQSVRQGVQTDRNLFWHPDARIQAVRTRALAAVRSYVDALPARQPGHPLLDPPRDRVLTEGSWAVRLSRGGHHAPHTHTHGWISSALHVALPATPRDGDRAGWLAFGAPPPELGLDLAPTHFREPRPGQLVLFPSTTWHSTVPFDSGERLTIAFDVRLPAECAR